MAQRRTRTTTGKSKNGDCYLLSGLLRCGCCGKPMYGTRKTRTKNGKTYVYVKYVCSGYQTSGTAVCGYCTVDQQEILDFIVAKLRQAILGGGHRDELRTRVRQELEARQTATPDRLAGMRRRLAEMDREIQTVTQRLLRVPDEAVDLLGVELAKLKRERDRQEAELDSLTADQPTDLDAATDAISERLWSLAAEFDTAEPARLREVIRQMVTRIELFFDKKQKRTRVERPFSNGTIDLRPDLVCPDLSVAGTGFEPATSRL